MSIENIRNSFRPRHITILFVGESPPGSGKFFYYGNSQMAENMERILGHYLFGNTEDFLNNFKESGCYLDDLVLEPGRPSPKIRKQAINDLAARIREYRPRVVVALLKRIADDVKEALEKSGTDACFYATCFPGNRQVLSFENDTKNILPVLKNAIHSI